jgi:histidine triad (HIT) family protein
MKNCIFCKIANGVIPSDKYYEDEKFVVVADIAPQAAKHFLVIPKRHYANVLETPKTVLTALFAVLPQIVEVLELTENGFRLITNCGSDARQSVKHLHFHILGGELLSESMA